MRRLILAILICLSGSPAWASGTLYYSAAATDWGTSSTWTPAGVPGSGDRVIIKHAVTMSSSQSIGDSTIAPAPTTAPTFNNTGTSGATSLAAGNYFVRYTNVDSSGNESSASPLAGGLNTTTNTTPRVTFPGAASGNIASRNIYLTKVNGADPNMYLYVSGITAATFDPINANYVNNTVAPGSLTAASLVPLGSGLAFYTGGSLSITGGTLTVQGDLVHAAACNVTMSAGTGLTFQPPANGQCTWAVNAGGLLTFNGSSGSHCTVTTNTAASGSSNTVMTVFAGAGNYGITTATYADFSNIGTTTQVGLQTRVDTAGNQAVSITNCTFTGCNYLGVMGGSNNWDGNYTFQYNKFTSSNQCNMSLGASSACFGLVTKVAPTSGTRLADSNLFDGNIGCENKNVAFTNNLVQGYYTGITSFNSWTSDSYFHNNIFYGNHDSLVQVFGPVRDLYLYHTGAGNPHYLLFDASVTNGTATGILFDTICTLGTGDCVFPPGITSGTPTLTVKNCICVPNAADNATSPGKLISDLQGATALTAVTVEHNTFAAYPSAGGGDANIGVVALDETNNSYAGEIASCRANLIWSPNVAARQYAVSSAGAGTPHIDAVTVAGFNAFWNPTTGTITANGSSVSAVGYNAIKVSGTYGLTSGNQIGYGDIGTVGTGINPQFVDPTRNLGKWGQLYLGASAGSDFGYSETITALITSGPANLATNIASLMSYVRAGYAPTNPKLINASYSGDPSTADAAGNAWPGGGPGIGAMGWTSASGGAALLPSARRKPRRPSAPVVIRIRPNDRIWRRAA